MAENGRSLTPVPAPAPGSSAVLSAVPGHLGGAQTGWTLYEVNIEIDPAVAADFDAWLPGHVDQILNLTGFAHADVLVREDVSEGPRAGWQRRTVHYRVRERAQLDEYLAQHAQRMRADALQRFGERASFERRTLTLSAHRSPGQVKLEYCANCGAVLGGQYCAACGQRARVRIISLWHLIREAAGDLTHLDSRLWRTMGPLLFRPGVLTNEYLAGRRARYIPPFRLYLGLSIVFFVLASAASSVGSDIVLDGTTGEPRELTPQDRAEIANAVAESKRRALEGLRARGITVPEPPTASPAEPASSATSTTTPTTPAATPAAASLSRPGQGSSPSGPALREGTEPQASVVAPGSPGSIPNKVCDELTVNIDMPGRAAFEQRARSACRKIAADQGGFLRAIVANVPKMMFVFLPLLALVNKALYPFSRRYYVEHLLFFVHYHAFVFLIFGLQTLFDTATASLPGLTAVRGLLTSAIVFYLPIYLYKAMRRVFGQGRLATLFKFSLLFIAYNVCLAFTMMAVLIYTALTL